LSRGLFLPRRRQGKHPEDHRYEGTHGVPPARSPRTVTII
jgi:hypothetical protein